MPPRMPQSYQLLRRLGFLFARFCGAAAHFGFLRAVRAYTFDFWRDAESAVRLPILGTHLYFRGRGDYPIMTAALFERSFYIEPDGFEVRTVIDLGANIGIESLRFAAFYPQAQIVSVEADPDNYRLLRQNIAEFERVTALHAAAWGTKARFRIQKNPHSNLASVVALAPEGDIAGVTIQGLIDELGVRDVDILKIDVEGAEDSLFGPSIADWIARVRVIVWELNDHEAPKALMRLVLAMAGAGVSFNFHVLGEKLIAVRTDSIVALHFACGLLQVL